MTYGIEFVDQKGSITNTEEYVAKIFMLVNLSINSTYTYTVPDFVSREGFVIHLGSKNLDASTYYTLDPFDYSYSGTTLTINTNDSYGQYIIGFAS